MIIYKYKLENENKNKSYFIKIYKFWNKNKKYHIAITPEDKAYIDNKINKKFFINVSKYSYKLITKEEKIGYVIYLDQFFRHLKRINMTITEELIYNNRKTSVKIAKELLKYDLTPDEMIIILMIFKHLKDYKFIFKTIYKNDIIKQKYFENNNFNKFYCDTYKKYIKETLKIKESNIDKLIHINEKVCEKYYKNNFNYTKSEIIEYNKDPIIYRIKTFLKRETDKTKQYLISLSGGVDSMVLTNLMKQLNNNIYCFHLIYGNRSECYDEFNIIQEYCNNLKIKLYYYNIKYFERKYINREFYEKMTTQIRFKCYELLKTDFTLLGHIKEDIIENIWSNFATGTNIDNLEGMKIDSCIYGINIKRPLLYVSKEDIFYIADKLKISHLLNTTPVWSNRGKFRNSLYPILKEHYKLNEDKTIKIAQDYKNLFCIAKELLYKKIILKFNINNKFIIKIKIIKLINISGWKYIFSKLEYFAKLKLSYPIIQNFTNRILYIIENNIENSKIVMNSSLILNIYNIDDIITIHSFNK